jgi:hypothetical protein
MKMAILGARSAGGSAGHPANRTAVDLQIQRRVWMQVDFWIGVTIDRYSSLPTAAGGSKASIDLTYLKHKLFVMQRFAQLFFNLTCEQVGCMACKNWYYQ